MVQFQRMCQACNHMDLKTMKLKNILLINEKKLEEKVKSELNIIFELEPDTGNQNFQIDYFGNCAFKQLLMSCIHLFFLVCYVWDVNRAVI